MRLHSWLLLCRSALAAAAIVGCGDVDNEPSSTSSTTTSSSAASGSGGGPLCTVGDLSVPGAALCAQSGAFGKVYLDDSGVPLVRSVLLTTAADACAWAETLEQAEESANETFMKVDVYGPVPGVCAVHAGPDDPEPPFAACVAVVFMRTLHQGKKLDLKAVSGSVEVTALAASGIVTKGSVRFPADPSYESECGGEDGSATTCECTSASGETSTCTTEVPEGGCCNAGKGEGQPVVWEEATSPECPLLCMCLQGVANCPC